MTTARQLEMQAEDQADELGFEGPARTAFIVRYLAVLAAAEIATSLTVNEHQSKELPTPRNVDGDD